MQGQDLGVPGALLPVISCPLYQDSVLYVEIPMAGAKWRPAKRILYQKNDT